MPHTAKFIIAVALLTSIGCDDKKTDDAKKPEGKAAAVGSDAKAPAGDAAKEEPAKAEIKLPELTATDVADWGVKIGLPAGAKVGEVEAGDAEMEMPDSTKLSTEAACGYDIDLTRHWAKSLDSMYENSKKAVDGLTEVKFLKDEKTATGYTIHYSGKAPLGDMYGASTGVVVGDRLVLCDAGLGRLEEQQAACVLAVCSSIASK